MVPIYRYTAPVGNTATSITFSNIPQGYTDLLLQVSLRGTDTPATSPWAGNAVQVNGNSSNIYCQTYFYLANNALYTSRDNNINYMSVFANSSSSTANSFGAAEYYIHNYSSGLFKTFTLDSATENNAVSNLIWVGAGLIKTNDPITSLYYGSITFAPYSTITLYGILRDSKSRPRATGGLITTDGTYWYHTFKSTADFFPLEPMQVEVLAVGAGGGGGQGDNGSEGGGGGGGGAIVTGLSDLLQPIGGYTVSVGTGGTGGNGYGANGGSSSFRGVFALGGGGGATGASGSGNVGSAGPNAGGGGRSGTGGLTTILTGYNGGNAAAGGGGGGGAGAVGSNAVSGTSGNGGIGSFLFSEWSWITGTGQQSGNYFYYSGGGAGGGSGVDSGTGGIGGGGNGGNAASSFIGYNGLANTGGGGGGGRGGTGTGKNGGNGGSGVVILRYRA